MMSNPIRVSRTRPLIPVGWQCKIPIKLDTKVIDVNTFRQIAEVAGSQVGLGDWRPGAQRVPGTFGRFIVESIKEVK